MEKNIEVGKRFKKGSWVLKKDGKGPERNQESLVAAIEKKTRENETFCLKRCGENRHDSNPGNPEKGPLNVPSGELLGEGDWDTNK